MKGNMERCQVVCNVLKTQIQFGFYRFGDVMPSIDNAAADFFVSVDTMRAAYLQLRREGFVTISTNVGTTVIKNYDKQEIEQNIQMFYAQRKNVLIDLSKSLRPLLGHAQWIGFQNVPAEIYSSLQQLESSHPLPQLTTFRHVVRAYTALENDLLFRLTWQIFMFCEIPFFNIPDNPWRAFIIKEFSPRSLDCCVKQDWNSLQKLIYASQDRLSLVLSRFYDDKIILSPPKQEAAFEWNSYNKASQICYSLAMDLLISINNGIYPADTLLPSLSKLSHEKQVSVSTVRRALSLLNGVGATKSIKRIGTRVLPSHEIAKNCDFKNPMVRKRLLDMAQSLQFLTLSCRSVAEITVQALGEDDLLICRNRLADLKHRQRYELIGYAALDLLKCFAPYQAIRTVYKDLLQMLFWGYSLKDIWKTDVDRTSYYRYCFEEFDRFLAEKDALRFSGKLEELILREFHFTIRVMISQGIHEAEKLLVLGL
ncbi:GntR family transcriptional regulator [Clostridium sp. MCC353]|uniref:GntR family transcriptional regulator n=1 Tax=Clostridium sp. MCC353 TaxID=2592646 RepID=UPI001C00E3E4|nr:GntR family transcriptional regulator [Clostridium sp. MCC353]MBT9776611.1 GntR family transcriptional regulator [Clostridium sp. MCC353]